MTTAPCFFSEWVDTWSSQKNTFVSWHHHWQWQSSMSATTITLHWICTMHKSNTNSHPLLMGWWQKLRKASHLALLPSFDCLLVGRNRRWWRCAMHSCRLLQNTVNAWRNGGRDKPTMNTHASAPFSKKKMLTSLPQERLWLAAGSSTLVCHKHDEH